MNDEQIECVQKYIYLGQEIGAYSDHENKNQKKNRDGMEGFW